MSDDSHDRMMSAVEQAVRQSLITHGLETGRIPAFAATLFLGSSSAEIHAYLQRATLHPSTEVH